MDYKNLTFREKVVLRHSLDKADKLMLCYEFNGMGYVNVLESFREDWVKEESMSSARGGGMKARVRLNKIARAALARQGVKLGTVEELDMLYRAQYKAAQGKDAPNNKGYMWECAVTVKLANQNWEPDSVPFYEAPDVTINGIGYQVKGDGAEYFTDKGLEKAAKLAGLA